MSKGIYWLQLLIFKISNSKLIWVCLKHSEYRVPSAEDSEYRVKIDGMTLDLIPDSEFGVKIDG